MRRLVIHYVKPGQRIPRCRFVFENDIPKEWKEKFIKWCLGEIETLPGSSATKVLRIAIILTKRN